MLNKKNIIMTSSLNSSPIYIWIQIFNRTLKETLIPQKKKKSNKSNKMTLAKIIFRQMH